MNPLLHRAWYAGQLRVIPGINFIYTEDICVSISFAPGIALTCLDIGTGEWASCDSYIFSAITAAIGTIVGTFEATGTANSRAHKDVTISLEVRKLLYSISKWNWNFAIHHPSPSFHLNHFCAKKANCDRSGNQHRQGRDQWIRIRGKIRHHQ
mmetsp:Transcript_7328/g.9149  ORF Transcript_7328/g.9149 Transcript_7328/m.9149 type:complete len:153 (+) Transcript_7328:436-894(+)